MAPPKTFSRVVESLGLNKGVTDPRHKVTFHTLRHTFASWLVSSGTSLYTVKELLGHKTSAMVERYSHLSQEAQRQAVGVIPSIMDDTDYKRKEKRVG